jgi:hypothetical protein
LRIVLTHWRAIAGGRIIPGETVRVITSHPPGDPPPRRPVSRYHRHLAPEADTRDTIEAVRRILSTDESRPQGVPA